MSRGVNDDVSAGCRPVPCRPAGAARAVRRVTAGAVACLPARMGAASWAGAAALGFLLLTGCSDAGGGKQAAPARTPATAPATTPAGTSTTSRSSPTAPATTADPTDDPDADPTAVPPADAQPCPATYDTVAPQPWVPALPGTETEGRLAPDADPVEVVLCRYAAPAAGPAPLDGPPVRITADLLRVRTDLQVPPKPGGARACTPEGPRVPYLARLTYADGDLWVASAATANGCADTGNGVFVSGSSRGAQLAASYDAGAWVPAVGS